MNPKNRLERCFLTCICRSVHFHFNHMNDLRLYFPSDLFSESQLHISTAASLPVFPTMTSAQQEASFSSTYPYFCQWHHRSASHPGLKSWHHLWLFPSSLLHLVGHPFRCGLFLKLVSQFHSFFSNSILYTLTQVLTVPFPGSDNIYHSRCFPFCPPTRPTTMWTALAVNHH